MAGRARAANTAAEELPPIVPGMNVADMPPPAPPQICMAFEPAYDGSLGERRCEREATDVVALGLVPRVFVPLCRVHASRVIDSAHRTNLSAFQGGV